MSFNDKDIELRQGLIILIDNLSHPRALFTFRFFVTKSISSSFISKDVSLFSVK